MTEIKKQLFGNINPEKYDAAAKAVATTAQSIAKLALGAAWLAGNLVAKGAKIVDATIRAEIRESKEGK